MRRFTLPLAFALVLLAHPGCKAKATAPKPPSVPGATTLISNLQGATNADISFSYDQGRSIAVGFTTPPKAHTLASVTLKLRTYQDVPQGLVVRLFTNAAQNNPGTELFTFTNPAIGANADCLPFTFLPPVQFVLNASTTYWIVAYYTGPDVPGWVCGNPSTTPIGLATHAGAKFDLFTLPNPPSTNTSTIGEYAVTAVPYP